LQQVIGNPRQEEGAEIQQKEVCLCGLKNGKSEGGKERKERAGVK
jgi:hypothetical protein